MKKTVLLFILSAITLFSCSEKGIELTTIDTLTGGREKEWEFVEYSYKGIDILSQPCDKDDTALFSKGNADSTHKGPYFKHLKNKIKCSSPGTGLEDKDTYLPFSLLPNSQILFGEKGPDDQGGVGNIWNIIDVNSEEVILHQMESGVKTRVLHLKTKTPISNDSTIVGKN